MSNYNRNNKYYQRMCEEVGEDFAEWLNQKYNVEKLNSRDIAELAYGKRKNGPNITNWMKKLEIPVRSRSEAVELQWVDNDKRRKETAERLIKNAGAGTYGRKKLIGIMQTNEYKTKQSVTKQGERNGMFGVFGKDHPKWNSELSKEDRENKRNYQEYISWRRKVYTRDNYTCQKCGDDKGGNLVVHHLNGFHWDKESRTEVDNGVTLCDSCHKEFHKLYGYGDNNLFQFSQYMNEMKV